MGYNKDSEEWKAIHRRWQQQMLLEEKQFKIGQAKFLAKQQSNKKKKKKRK
jgi:hypothetical protein